MKSRNFRHFNIRKVCLLHLFTTGLQHKHGMFTRLLNAGLRRRALNRDMGTSKKEKKRNADGGTKTA